MPFLSFVLNLLDPFKIIRKCVFRPLAVTGVILAEQYKRKSEAGIQTTRAILLKMIVAIVATAVIFWGAILLYAYFYYTYMPTVSHVKDVYLNYRDCLPGQKCSEYPSDTVVLTNKQRILMVGQPYRVTLYLEMPESGQNDKTGMFTVCATMQDREASENSKKSCRLSMIHYKSNLLKMISTVVMAPFYVLGYREEKQVVVIELFKDFEDYQTDPVTSVEVAILSKEIQFYSAKLHITANFYGLRYLMYEWPILSAILGIVTILFFLVIVCILSWYHWDESEWLVEVKERYQQILQVPEALGQATTTLNALPENDKSEEGSENVEDIPRSENVEDSSKSENMEDIPSFNENLGLAS